MKSQAKTRDFSSQNSSSKFSIELLPAGREDGRPRRHRLQVRAAPLHPVTAEARPAAPAAAAATPPQRHRVRPSRHVWTSNRLKKKACTRLLKCNMKCSNSCPSSLFDRFLLHLLCCMIFHHVTLMQGDSGGRIPGMD